jgi:hypothetical protein
MRTRLYQARVCKAWHNELKAGHFFNLAKLNDKKLNAYRKEVDAKNNAAVNKAVSPSLYPQPITQLTSRFPFLPILLHRTAASSCFYGPCARL